MSNYSGGRIQSIDALRGLCVILMCIHHLLYDIAEFLGAPWIIFSNPVFDVLHYIFAGTFIALSGVSSRFSRSNVKRGVKVLICAVVISAVTWFMKMPVYFGVLHLLGFSMVFYGLTHKLWDAIPVKLAPFLFAALTVLSAPLAHGITVQNKFTWMFGFVYEGFYSADYFPILPWLFVFLFGTWLGERIKAGTLPKLFYTLSPPLLPGIGRRALIVYMLHQPVLYGATLLAGKILGIL